MKHLILAVMALAMITASVSASPTERVQLIKTGLTRRLMLNGWQLVQETPSMIVFQRQGNPLDSVLMGLLVGAGGTLATIQLSFTLVSVNDHYSEFAAHASMSSQSAFGKTETVPITNGRMKRDIAELLKAVAASLPAQYRSSGYKDYSTKP
jgi:hypothetical protein